ncbi:MAG: hypothetical protein IPI12_01335 [Ignavibacteriales bacterium]|jgi:hypothetical protein|nr:hypothetical protein [Ignavibacteriales bacterium]MBP9123692.1 hypothetical protein [Ignavibacteriaceae bacterium]
MKYFSAYSLYFFLLISTFNYAQDFIPKFDMNLQQTMNHYKIEKWNTETVDIDGSTKYFFKNCEEFDCEKKYGFAYLDDKLQYIDVSENHWVDFKKFWNILDKRVKFWKKQYGKLTFTKKALLDEAETPIPENQFTMKNVEQSFANSETIFIRYKGKGIELSAFVLNNIVTSAYYIRTEYLTSLYRVYLDKKENVK